MKNILISGVAGFIGSHTAEKLLQMGYRIIGIDNLNDYYDVKLKKSNLDNLRENNQFKFIKIDITDFKSLNILLNETSFDYIIHLAAQAGVRYSNAKPLLYQRVNIEGTLNLLEIARLSSCKTFIFGSSSSVYGNQEIFPILETANTTKPISVYAATKQAGESLCHSYSHLYGIDINTLRFFTVYGPRGRPDMSPYIFTKSIIDKKPIKIFESISGTIKRDFTYISDAVAGIISALHFNHGFNAFNISSGIQISLMDFISQLEVELGEKANIERHSEVPGDVRITYADISKARSKLGFNPRMDLNQGIKGYIDWYKSYYL